MVAHPAHHRVAAAGCDPDLHRQLRHRLDAVSVSLSDARAAQYPRRLGVLSRRGCRAGGGRKNHRRCAGGTFHAQEKRFRFSASRRPVLSPPREPDVGAARRGGVLRQAHFEICATARNVSRRHARRLAHISHRVVQLARRETGFAQNHSR